MVTLKNVLLVGVVVVASTFSGFCWGTVNEGGTCPVTKLLNEAWPAAACDCANGADCTCTDCVCEPAGL
jgi:hypothetical protein